MKTVKKQLVPGQWPFAPVFLIMNGSPIKNRNGKMNGTGRSQCERDGRMNGNGSDLKKLPSNAAPDTRLAVLDTLFFTESRNATGHNRDQCRHLQADKAWCL